MGTVNTSSTGPNSQNHETTTASLNLQQNASDAAATAAASARDSLKNADTVSSKTLRSRLRPSRM